MKPRWVRKSHRWIGGVAALWLIALASTGVLLQHAEDWGLDRKWVRSAWLLRAHGYLPTRWHYPVPDPLRHALPQPSIAVQQYGQHTYRLLLGKDQWLDLPGLPLSVVPVFTEAAPGDSPDKPAWSFWLVFPESLWQVDRNGQILGQWDGFDGLPPAIVRAGLNAENNALLLERASPEEAGATVFDLAKARVMSHPDTHRTVVDDTARKKVVWLRQAEKSHDSRSQPLAATGLLSWQKMLFLWHAGLMGSWWLNDLAAAALIYLALSGIWLFFRKKRKNQKSG